MTHFLSISRLPVGQTWRHLSVGPWSVSCIFQQCADAYLSSSGVALRLAENLVANVLGIATDRVRVATLLPAGRPIVTVVDTACCPMVSVSHALGLYGAILSHEAQVGIDIVHPDEVAPSLETFFTPRERAMLWENNAFFCGCLWAAKEAAYKAARLDIGFQPLRVHINNLTVGGFQWSLFGPRGRVEGAGTLAMVNQCIVAFAATRAASNDAAGDGCSDEFLEEVA